MKVLVITSSPHRSGTTAALADEFIKGVNEAGHEVDRFDAAFKNVHPCIACEVCHTKNNGCAFKDDMQELNPLLIAADVITFVTPIYYYDINAQLKAVIDRFYANDSALHKNKKMVYITAMADITNNTAKGLITTFEGMANFLEWENAGGVVAVNCMDKAALEKTDYLKQAFKLGKNL